MKVLNARVEALLTTENPENFVTSRVPQIDLMYEGIPGDRHFGYTKLSNGRERMYPRGTEIRNRRQVSILSQEECDEAARRLGIKTIKPEWLGANMVISGFPSLSQLPSGSRILFPSGASLYCEGENFPCIYPGQIIQSYYEDIPKLPQRFVKEAYGLRGIVCSVEREGEIRPDSTIDIYVNLEWQGRNWVEGGTGCEVQ
ncbi:MOSC domain-containing protein [Neobacillus sp. MER 74]|uniref:MOSC domain-containing protein n=1 Tax=Neobacillus sp. MER 74 TaxID=2939566 RepID=UPI00203DBF0A|nr:MOSC domain-containing protein [Neobacillus sp. MER 74]MCM3115368.1 MOSC domain-containing protein [Neobacillus sp. MER 74]